MLGVLGSLGSWIVQIARSIHQDCFSPDALKGFGRITVKWRRCAYVVTVVGPGLPNPVVGIKAALEPGIFKALDPINDVEPLGIFRPQTIGCSRCKREKHVDPGAPSLFR